MLPVLHARYAVICVPHTPCSHPFVQPRLFDATLRCPDKVSTCLAHIKRCCDPPPKYDTVLQRQTLHCDQPSLAEVHSTKPQALLSGACLDYHLCHDGVVVAAASAARRVPLLCSAQALPQAGGLRMTPQPRWACGRWHSIRWVACPAPHRSWLLWHPAQQR